MEIYGKQKPIKTPPHFNIPEIFTEVGKKTEAPNTRTKRSAV